MKIEDALELGDETGLVDCFYKVADTCWKRSFRGYLEREDALQLAAIDCWRRRESFDPSRATASTYFYLVSWSAMKAEKKRQYRLKNRILQDATEIDKPIMDEAEGPLDSAIRQERRESFQEALRELPDRERFTLIGRMEGRKLMDIAIDLGVTQEAVRQMQLRAYSKVEKWS